MNSSTLPNLSFNWSSTFENLLFKVLDGFKLTLDSITLKTFSKIAWRWRHSKLRSYGTKVIKIKEDDFVAQFGVSRQKIKKVLLELREKRLIDWELDETGVVCWLADKGQGVLKESSYL